MKRSKVTLIILLLGLCCSVYLTTASSLEEEQGERAAKSKTLLTNVKNRIQHFIVLMMENRSFDHLLGWLKQKDGRVEGLTGKEYNCVIPGQFEPGFPCVTVSQDAPEFSPGDPSHTFDAQVQQIFGYDKPVTVNVNQSEELMNGFVWNANNTGIPISTPMRMFTSQADSAPILNTLAQEFGLFNYWYTSGPLPTDPNRGFAMSGTSNGMINNFNGTLWSQQSYFNLLTQHNVSWQAFYDADLWALGYYQDMYLPENAVKIADIEVFFQQLRQQPASLPAFTWLQPRMLAHPQVGLPNWQHPDASLREGERLIKSVYEALRSSSLWENSALLITYDEHGGFFDHVPPPTQGIPSPDGVISSTNGYTFNTLGMRLPSVIVSPWIPKGLIINEPSPQQQPTPTSHFEGTSAIATANKLFSVPQYLTARHAWAATFEDLFTLLPVARQDTPATLPDLPPALPDAMHSQRQKPLNDHMAIQVQFYCTQNRLPSCPDPEQMNQGEASDFILQQLPLLLAKMKAPQQ